MFCWARARVSKNHYFGASHQNVKNLTISRTCEAHVTILDQKHDFCNPLRDSFFIVLGNDQSQEKYLFCLILSNNYLEIKVNNGDNTSKHIICYDQNSKKFNRWEFKNDGTNTFWIGEWNKNDKTMTWDFIDFSGNGILGQIIERVESEAIIYSEIIMKDKDGNTLLKINSTKKKI